MSGELEQEIYLKWNHSRDLHAYKHLVGLWVKQYYLYFLYRLHVENMPNLVSFFVTTSDMMMT